MPSPTRSRNPEHRASHVPNLSCRRSLNFDQDLSLPDTSPSTPDHEDTSTKRFDLPTLGQSCPGPTGDDETTGTFVRFPKNPKQHSLMTSPVSVRPKKKGSIFGNFFAKEASSQALEQVAAQLIAQHGELSARAIPGVSATKMPETVPKVNSKWDGVPESVKLRERQDEYKVRHRGQTANRYSLANYNSSQSMSSEEPVRRPSSSEAELWSMTLLPTENQGRAAPNRDNLSTEHSSRRHSSWRGTSPGFRSATPEYSDMVAQRSLRSPSEKSLPEITCFFPNEIPDPPSVPSKFRQSDTAGDMYASRSTGWHHNVKASIPLPLPEHQLPEYSSSLASSPQERSPVTPFGAAESIMPEPNSMGGEIQLDQVELRSRGAEVLCLPSTVRRKVRPSTDAFLAGEAKSFELPNEATLTPRKIAILNSRPTDIRPPSTISAISRHNLEERPDSSRARLGLRASMLIQTDNSPWE